MFTVHSTVALSWPTLGFRVKKGFNQFKSRDDVPAEAMTKLDYLSKSRVDKESGKRRAAVVRFDGQPVAGARDTDEDVELTEESLSKQSFKKLQAIAGKLSVDVTGLRSKDEVAAKILAAAQGSSAGARDTDEDEGDESDDDADD